jgi:hypothetical protein
MAQRIVRVGALEGANWKIGSGAQRRTHKTDHRGVGIFANEKVYACP